MQQLMQVGGLGLGGGGVSLCTGAGPVSLFSSMFTLYMTVQEASQLSLSSFQKGSARRERSPFRSPSKKRTNPWSLGLSHELEKAFLISFDSIRLIYYTLRQQHSEHISSYSRDRYASLSTNTWCRYVGKDIAYIYRCQVWLQIG